MLSEKLAKFLPSHNGNSTYTSQESSSCENSNISIFDKSSDTSENKYNYDLVDSIFDKKSDKIKNCSSVGAYGDIGGSVVDAVDGESKDGKIGKTKQGLTGDCWVLSAINSVNSTQKGKELIKEALEYSENGTYVNLKGAGYIYISRSFQF